MRGGAGFKLRHSTVLRKSSMNNELMTQHNKVELRKSINIP